MWSKLAALLRAGKAPLVVATLVAVVGLAGTAAAKRWITGADIKDGSLSAADFSKGARLALEGDRGPRGLPGVTGPAGPSGPVGPKGASGPTGERGPVGARGETGPAGPIGARGERGRPGPHGERGASAYYIWLWDGHEGDYTDFLDSLKGQSAYDIWVAAKPENANKTEDEFLASLKGQDGHDGADAVSYFAQVEGTNVTRAKGIDLTAEQHVDTTGQPDGVTLHAINAPNLSACVATVQQRAAGWASADPAGNGDILVLTHNNQDGYIAAPFVVTVSC